MGCNCGGSTRRQAQPAERDGKLKAAPERRRGGPGEPGYYWTGPKGKQAPKPPVSDAA